MLTEPFQIYFCAMLNETFWPCNYWINWLFKTSASCFYICSQFVEFFNHGSTHMIVWWEKINQIWTVWQQKLFITEVRAMLIAQVTLAMCTFVPAILRKTKLYPNKSWQSSTNMAIIIRLLISKDPHGHFHGQRHQNSFIFIMITQQ